MAAPSPNTSLKRSPVTPSPCTGTGSQTRSLCYVDDLIDGMVRLLHSEYSLPVNLGNPHEITMIGLAELVRDLCGSSSRIELRALPVDDPKRRCPDVSVAQRELQWNAVVSLSDALQRTIDWWPRGSSAPDEASP